MKKVILFLFFVFAILINNRANSLGFGVDLGPVSFGVGTGGYGYYPYGYGYPYSPYFYNYPQYYNDWD